MDDGGRPHLWGRERRYLLTELLWERGPMTVADLVANLEAEGWCVGGRASKTISDALRWEIAHGRVVRLGRGRYGPGRMPKQTRSWIRCRNRRTRAEAQDQLSAARHGDGRPATIDALPAVHQHSPRDITAPWSPSPPVHRPASTERPPNRTRSVDRPAIPDADVVIVGAGWSEEEDAAEDEALRQRLLATLRPRGVSGEST